MKINVNLWGFILIFIFMYGISYADLSSNVEDYIADAKVFVNDVEDVVAKAENDDLDRLMDRAKDVIDIAEDLYDAADTDDKLRTARSWAKVAEQYAMDAISDPLVVGFDEDELARKRYEKAEDAMDDKKEDVEGIVYGSDSGNALAEKIFEIADGCRDVTKDFEDIADYRKAFYIAVKTKALYNRAKKVAQED